MRTLSCLIAALVAATPSIGAAQDTSVTTVAAPDDPGAPAATATHISLESGATPGEDLAATLNQVPGVQARSTSYGQTAFATIRGGNARQLAVELEGLRLSPPFGPGYDLSTTSLLGFDALTVWRGPAATFRGSGALTGALEFRTRHARQPGVGARVHTLLGSHESTEVRGEAAVADDSLSVRLGANHRRSEGSFPFVDAQGVDHVRVNNDHQRVGLFASARKHAGPTTVRATALYDGGERGTPGVSEFQEQFRFARLTDHQVLGLVRVDRTDLLPHTDTWLVAGQQYRTLHYENPQPFLRGEAIDERAESSTTQAAAGASIWLDRDTALVELEARNESWRGNTVDASRLVVGLGTSWEHRLADDRVGLWGGARAEAVQAESIALLPSLGAWWRIVPELRLRATAGRTYRTPDLDELYLQTESLRGDPDLLPETAWSADVGAEWTHEDASAALTLFGRRVSDEILFLPVTAYLVQALNVAGSRALGVEARASARLFERIDTDLSYALVDARFVETAVAVPLQPQHQGFARAAVRLGRTLRAIAEVDARSAIFLDTFGNQRARGAAFVDAGLVGGRELVWAVFVRNLFDDRGAVDSLQQPIPGRTLWASITLGGLP